MHRAITALVSGTTMGIIIGLFNPPMGFFCGMCGVMGSSLALLIQLRAWQSVRASMFTGLACGLTMSLFNPPAAAVFFGLSALTGCALVSLVQEEKYKLQITKQVAEISDLPRQARETVCAAMGISSEAAGQLTGDQQQEFFKQLIAEYNRLLEQALPAEKP